MNAIQRERAVRPAYAEQYSDLTSLFNDAVRAHSADIAFRTKHGEFSFAQVQDLVQRVAQGLRTAGVAVAGRVAALTRHIAETSILTLAAARIGAVCCPLNWRLSPQEIAQILQDSEATFLMVDEEFFGAIETIGLSASIEVVLTLAGTSASARPGFREWAQRHAPSAQIHTAARDDTALQLYSSGTTGLPKGIELSNSNMLHAIDLAISEFGFDAPRTVILHALPTFHIAGMGLALSSLCSGATAIVYAEFVPDDVIDSFGRHGVTHTFLVPSMIQLLLQRPRAAQGDYKTLQMIGYGASPITESVLVEAMRVFKCGLTQVYGLTETSGMVVALSPADHDPSGPRAHLLRSAGRALPGTRLQVVDPETSQPLPDGEIGEIWIHSRLNMLRYWRNPKATAEAYPQGLEDGVGWFRSGDAGYLENGYLYIKDRIKDMIISGGENVYPIEIENALMKHPDVQDCAVIGVDDPVWGESVMACVVPRPGHAPSSEDLIAFCRSKIAHYKSPRKVAFLETLPRNPSGKLLKNVLREQFRAS